MTKTPPHCRSIDLFNNSTNNQLLFVCRMCFGFVLQFMLVYRDGLGSGLRIPTMMPLCDEGMVATHFHSKKQQIWFGNFIG
jgi:hypothetical protein